MIYYSMATSRIKKNDIETHRGGYLLDDLRKGKMKIGFVGNKQPLTLEQIQALKILLDLTRATELHHRDRLGGDFSANQVALEMHICTVAHVPEDKKGRGWAKANLYLIPASHMEAKKSLVEKTDLIIATSDNCNDKLFTRGSSVWSIVHYASRGLGKRVIVIKKNGAITQII
jgi:hypothetical protein